MFLLSRDGDNFEWEDVSNIDVHWFTKEIKLGKYLKGENEELIKQK